MEDKELFMRVSEKDFNEVKSKYENYNRTCKETMLYHVGMGAGLYSELGGMLEAVAYCYENRICFRMYADDATFCKNGWTDFFEEFCELNHNRLNRKGNYRFKVYHRTKNGLALPNLFLKRIIYPNILKRKERVDWLYQDLFPDIVSKEFHNSNIEYSLFHMKGRLHDEYAKMALLCLRYNERTAKEIKELIESIHLPKSYISIQIRGGDKTLELENLKSEEFFLDLLTENVLTEKNIFVFSDDYRSIEYLKAKRPEWNIYTLTGKHEKGYYNEQFNKLSYEQKRRDIIKVFAMVEICIQADLHIGCRHACVNNFIRSARKINDSDYTEYELGTVRSSDLKNKMLRIFNK